MIFLLRRLTLAGVFIGGWLSLSVVTHADMGAVSPQELSTLFISAFEKNDVPAMESLVCWDNVSAKSHDKFMDQLKGEMGGRISEVSSRNIENETFQPGDYEKIINSLNVENPSMLVYMYEKNGEVKGGGKFIGNANGRFYISGFKDPKSNLKIFLIFGAVIAIALFFRKKK